MVSEVIMPKLGPGMKTGTIIEWLKQEGDPVKKGEPIVEIMTDKIEMEIEAQCSGILLKRLYQTDEDVSVQEVIAYIGDKVEIMPEINPAPNSLTTTINESTSPTLLNDNISLPIPNELIRRTPAARKLAAENHIDLSEITGTGPFGRIQLIDVENHLHNHQSPKATPLAKKIADDQSLDLAQIQGTGFKGKILKEDVVNSQQNSESPLSIPKNIEQKYQIIPMSRMRKTIGERMQESVITAPHVTLMSEIDMSKVIELRSELLTIIEKTTGHRLSYSEIITKAVAVCLKKHPMINSSIEKSNIILHSEVHVGFAVAVKNGLVVPVIKNADQKGLAQITEESKTLAKLAHENQLKSEHLTGGTFTISNLGMYAVDSFTPIINQPQTAILGVGRIKETPVGVNHSIELRPMMKISLSFDHRVVDGAPAAEFLTELVTLLEQPYKLLV